VHALELKLEDEVAGPRTRGPWARATRRFVRQRSALVALVILATIFVTGLLSARIAPYDLTTPDFAGLYSAPSWHHLFGTDIAGRDSFSRALHGIRTSELLALQVAVGATLIGTVVGAIAGYAGRWADNLFMRATELVAFFPALAIILLGTPTAQMLRNVLVLYMWTPIARVVRAELVSLREREYIEAARASGASPLRIVLRHLLPNAAGSLIVATTAILGQVILLEATVGFFNYGINPERDPSLGNLIATGVQQGVPLDMYWWLWALPATVLVVMLVCVNVLGDALDDALAVTRG
jgi:peptide/nickel transport system permease protein